VGAGHPHVLPGCDDRRLARDVRKGPVDQQVLHDAELTQRRAAEREARADRGPGGQTHRDGVLAVVDGHGARTVDAPLVGGVGPERAVPVDVVRGDVEHDGGVRSDRRAPVELEARQLDGEHVLVGQHGVQQRQPDVARGDGAQAGGAQDRREHAHGRRLAVGAGDGQPGGAAGRAQPPGELDLAEDLDPRGRRGDEQRRVGTPAG
jgi:hypothetical protein